VSAAPVQLRPLGVGEILDVGLKIFWRNAGTMLKAVIFVVLPAQILTNLVIASATPNSAVYKPSFNTNPALASLSAVDTGTYLVGILISTAIAWFATKLALAACFRAVADGYLGNPSDWRSSLKFAFRRLHSVVWITFLGGLLSGLAAIACLVPGIYLGTAWSVAVPVLLLEGTRGRKALGRSKRLVDGRWWPVFAVVIVGYIFTQFVGGVFGAIAVGFSFVDPDPQSIAGFLVRTLSGTLSSVLTTPITAAFIIVLYIDLRVRQEAFDLQLLAERVGVDPGTVPTGPPLPEDAPSTSGEQPPYWPPPPGWKPRGGGEIDPSAEAE
jgi:hypothetical protein